MTTAILIACEESQVEVTAWRSAGYNAYSCDIQPARGGHPEWHIHGDVTPYLTGVTSFCTQDGKKHRVPGWTLIIAHPPCTYLSKVGCPNLYLQDGSLDEQRLSKMREAREFFQQCLDAKSRYVVVENPIPMKRAKLPPCSFYACPSWYGSRWTKKTLYWQRGGIPPLMPRAINPRAREYHKAHRGKYRSVSFSDVAAAMVEQWGPIITEEGRQ